jgi:hypothetical protein
VDPDEDRTCMDDSVSVTAEFHPDTDAYAVMIALEVVEVNVLVPKSEVPKFAQVRDASWDARGSIRIGSVLGSPAFWCTDQGTGAISLLVGQDDETSEVCVTFPPPVVEMIVAELAACSESSVD